MMAGRKAPLVPSITNANPAAYQANRQASLPIEVVTFGLAATQAALDDVRNCQTSDRAGPTAVSLSV